MRKEMTETIDKVWGEEIVLVNNENYCAKFLNLDKNAVSSLHYHKTKIETFTCLAGFAILTIEGKEYQLLPWARPKTIYPGEVHQFRGVEPTSILEVSTQHKEEDVVRLSESKAGKTDAEIIQEGAKGI